MAGCRESVRGNQKVDVYRCLRERIAVQPLAERQPLENKGRNAPSGETGGRLPHSLELAPATGELAPASSRKVFFDHSIREQDAPRSHSLKERRNDAMVSCEARQRPPIAYAQQHVPFLLTPRADGEAESGEETGERRCCHY